MYLEIFSGGFRGISRFFWNFAEIPELRGSATARNIRSPDINKKIIKSAYLCGAHLAES